MLNLMLGVCGIENFNRSQRAVIRRAAALKVMTP